MDVVSIGEKLRTGVIMWLTGLTSVLTKFLDPPSGVWG